ncbi:MAG: DUF6106 family protein [Defluviitaleaceae bacterium]|nr:DUF6106 family protein [Defluviitaleaceae bacterium]
MTDIFKEQLVKRNPNTQDRLMKAAIIIGVALIFLLTMQFAPMFAPIISIAAGFGAYIFIGRLKREYEYSFTNGELDIDVIYNRSSRKRVFTGQVRNFELMAHIDDTRHQNSFASVAESKDYSTGTPSERSYVFIANYDNKRQKIIIEPNNEMLEAIAKSLTRSKFYPKQ